MQADSILLILQKINEARNISEMLEALCRPLIEEWVFFDHLVILKSSNADIHTTLAATDPRYENTQWPTKRYLPNGKLEQAIVVNQRDDLAWLQLQSAAVSKSISSAALISLDSAQLIFMFTRKRQRDFSQKDVNTLLSLRPLLEQFLLNIELLLDAKGSETMPEMRKFHDEQLRFKTYAELATDWFWESDQDLNYRMLSIGKETLPEGLEQTLGKSLFDSRSAKETQLYKKWSHFIYLTNRHKPFRKFEFEISLEKGNRWVSVSGQPMFTSENVFTGYLGTATDITYIKQREVELYAAKKIAETANAAKSQFVAMMSHELRTPLNVVLGNIELLLNTPLDKEQQNMLQFTQTSTKLLQTIISDILDLAKIEAGTFDLREEVVNPVELVNNVVSQFQREAEIKGLNLAMSASQTVLKQTCIYAVRVAQVLFNLIGNAIKYTDKGNILVLLEQQGKKLVFSVQDTGCGISTQHSKTIFQPFEQVAQVNKPRGDGAGLGLSICQRIVKLMDGELKFTSALNVGSTFTFYVPCLIMPTGQQGLESHTVKNSLTRPLNVLVAEDHVANQILIKAMLKQRGHNVLIAENGKVALEKIGKSDLDIVLMDMMMPELNGIEATKKIRAFTEFSNLPIIALTANVSVEDRNACIQAGMNDFLTKPLSGEALDNALTKWSSSM